MAVKLRLRRGGRKARPFYWIVASDSRSPRDGKYIEQLGSYDPMTEPAAVSVDHDAALKWLRQGAQPTDTVRSILSKEGVLLKFHLHRKGKSEEEIVREFERWQNQRDIALGRAEQKRKASQESRLSQQLEAERKRRAAIQQKVDEKRAAASQALADAAREAAAEAAGEAADTETAEAILDAPVAEAPAAEEAPAE